MVILQHDARENLDIQSMTGIHCSRHFSFKILNSFLFYPFPVWIDSNNEAHISSRLNRPRKDRIAFNHDGRNLYNENMNLIQRYYTLGSN